MNLKLILRLTWGKLRSHGTYVLALIVGTLINLYGQLLVPWLRDAPDPIGVFLDVLERNPGTTVLSIFLGYAFPFFVGTYSAVAARYNNRRMESVADFPDRKPDPVFRVNRNGDLVETGALTGEWFVKHKISNASAILGEAVWSDIRHDRGLDPGTTVRFDPEGIRYVVAYAPTADDQINIYLTRLGV